MKYLWDTNIIIYFLQDQFPPDAAAIVDAILQEGSPTMSVISEIELLCWKNATPQDITVIQGFIDGSRVLFLDEPVKRKTIEIRRAYKIKLPDAIIAASALAHDLVLVTRNTSDFTGIRDLKCIDPFN